MTTPGQNEGGKPASQHVRSPDGIRNAIPEFLDAAIEAAYRAWSMPDTVRRARSALWVGMFAVPVFAINDIRLLGAGTTMAALLVLRGTLTLWSALLLLRLSRAIDVKPLDRHLLAWAVAVDVQSIAASASRPPDFAPSLMVAQTILYALVVFWPLRVVPRAVNGACLAVALVVILWWTGAITPAIAMPLSIAVVLALALGLPMVLHVERLGRQEFARMRREQAQMQALLEAKEGAEAADRAKTRFLAVVSHEVRTPMNGVLGVLQLMEGSHLDAMQRRQVAIARDCAESLTGLLDTIIDYARLGNTVDTPVPVDFDPRQWVQSVVDLLRPRALARQTDMEVHIEDNVPGALHADAHRLRQVAINLLSNAVKFTERGRISVGLSLRADDAGQLLLALVVEDDGIGIPAMQLGRVFEEFTQADESIARRFGGAGLGLAICRRVVSLLGGTIAATSESGVGSRFFIEVPVAACRASLAPVSVSSRIRRLRVLVVDDDPINQIVACGLLAQAGHDATPVADGPAALAELEHEDFDVVFMDLHMPLMDGFEAARRMRALSQPDRACVPIVALTADMLLIEDARFVELGLSGVLPKPLRRDALCRVLATISADAGPAPARPETTWLSDASVDLVHLSEQVDALGTAAVARLVHLFRQIGRRLLGDLHAAVMQGDTRLAAELAHRFGSSASALGLARLCRSADRVEQAAKRGTSPELIAQVTALAIEFRGAFDALRDLAHEARAVRAQMSGAEAHIRGRPWGGTDSDADRTVPMTGHAQ